MTRIRSVIEGRDCDVLDTMFRFYGRPKGWVLDVTCNRRKSWKGLNTDRVKFCDIDPGVNPDVVCSYTDMPFRNESVSVVYFDPPHLPKAAGSEKSHRQYKKDYGLSLSVSGDNISETFRPFLKEANRILKPDGLVFAKIIDFVHNHKYQWSLCDFVAAVRDTGGMTPTDLIIKRDPAGGRLTSGRWVRTHHSRRVHCWFVVVRKGKCEPSREYLPQLAGTKT